jgi:DNA-directed RNA polymerases I, II, and III subunit RPABC1
MNAQTVGNLNPEASKLFRIQRTCWKMLKKRGYNVDDSHINMTTEEFQREFGDNPARESLTILVQKVDDPEEQLYVFFPEGDKSGDKLFSAEKIGVTHLKLFYARMKNENVRRAIVIVRNNLTPIAKQMIKEVTLRGKNSSIINFNDGKVTARLCMHLGYRMEYFREMELLVDITEHKLVPEHIVLSQQQKQELLDRYRLKPSQLPRIQVTDAVARYLGLKPHQVVKIIRPSETAGRYITYRICI